MPAGKPAGVVCVNLDTTNWRCRIWGSADYPEACKQFAPAVDVCGNDREEALALISALELSTGD